MKGITLLVVFLVTISISSLCQVNIKDTLNKKPADPKDRNLFGIGIPRGLTITSDSLTDGYVL